MDYLNNLPFNSKIPTVMHIDLNSCFATIEQQANPLLRGKPIAVAVHKSPNGCIVAPSIEAKKIGIKVGMRVRDAKILCPNIIVMEPDPWKYRNVHLAIKKLLQSYTQNVVPKSIDEFVLDLDTFPIMKKGTLYCANQIKERIKKEIGEWLLVSIGIAPNRYLAKIASNIHKPNGLDIIDYSNFLKVYENLELTDLCGIKTNSAVRLNRQNIYTVLDFYNSSPKKLQTAFHSITGYYWYLRLHGFEVDDVVSKRGSYSNSVVLSASLSTTEQLSPILMNLVEKMAYRMRLSGYSAKGVGLFLYYRNGNKWNHVITKPEPLFSSRDVYKIAYKILTKSPYKTPVRTIAVSCFDLVKPTEIQLSMLGESVATKALTTALDNINNRWGSFVITPAKMLTANGVVKDRIAFGGVKELEEFALL